MLRAGCIAVLVSLSGIAYASDWLYAGAAKADDINLQFFDAASVSHATQDVTRVWVKSIRRRDLDRYYKAHEESVTDQTARKIATGYIPAYLMLPVIRASSADANALKDAAMDLTTAEVMANVPDIQLWGKLYYEIDCVGKRIKVLDGTLYNSDGSMSNKGRIRGDYESIPPDSTGEWLSLLVCPSK